MIRYSSCAELESILNEAAINAAYAKRESISMDDLTKAVLRKHYGVQDDCAEVRGDHLKEVALHEAGHLVVSEVLCPGSVGLASLRTTGENGKGGFIMRCRELERRVHYILVLLAGKAAVELYHSKTCANGCQSDIKRAVENIREAIQKSGICGLSLVDVTSRRGPEASESLKARTEAAIHAELERYLFISREILQQNRVFLEKAAAALEEKETLLYSDIRALRESVTVIEVAV